MELTPHLKLMQWLLTHTFLLSGNETNKPITNNEIKNIFFKEFPDLKQELNKEINLLIGQFLKYIYGSDLIKYDAKPIKYNIGIVKAPIKEVFIRDYQGVYNFDYYNNYNKYNFVDVKQTYNSLNKFFKYDNTNIKPLKQKDFIKIDNLTQEVIIYCLNKGIPKQYLKYFLFYCMAFLNPRDLNLMLHRCKQHYKKNKVCAICGSSENLTIHHIKKVSSFPYLEFNKNNFIVLCDKCHKQHHQKQDKRQSHQQRQKELKEVLQYANL